jgi:hypothetical protein
LDIPGMPEIPTDNLYKFVALSGILMMLVGFAVPPVIRYRAMQADLALLAEYRASNTRRDRAFEQLSRSIELMETANLRELDRLRAGSKTDDTTKAQLAEVFRTANAISDSAQAVADSAQQIDIETLDAAVQADREFFAFFVWVGWVLALAGIVLATWGFRNWYIKLQKPLDELVRLDAESRRATTSPGSR